MKSFFLQSSESIHSPPPPPTHTPQNHIFALWSKNGENCGSSPVLAQLLLPIFPKDINPASSQRRHQPRVWRRRGHCDSIHGTMIEGVIVKMGCPTKDKRVSQEVKAWEENAEKLQKWTWDVGGGGVSLEPVAMCKKDLKAVFRVFFGGGATCCRTKDIYAELGQQLLPSACVLCLQSATRKGCYKNF